ncbi:MAG: hypothetical protein K2H23_05660 [Oscillospiraceae bacterium]|nr:hypothetical protein [Oscillospiraceae bacterium]
MTDGHITPQRRRKDILLPLLAAMYFLGVLLGTVLYCTLDSEKITVLDSIAGSFVDGRLRHTFWETLVNSFSGAFILLLICFGMGFCVIAQPAELLVPLFRGLGTGASIAGMYSGYGLAGAGAAAVLIVPNAVATAFVMIIAAREAFRFSVGLYAASLGNSRSDEPVDVRLYFTKFVILCVILVISALADSLITFASAGVWSGLLGI